MTSTRPRFHNFDTLKKRLRLQGKLTTKTALHIGAGGGDMLGVTDMPVIRDAAGHPVIPGSALKGVVRSTIEGLLRAISGAHSRLWTCNPLSKEKDLSVDRTLRACGHHGTEGRKEAEEREHCAACQLFGSHVVASHVRFSDSIYLKPSDIDRSPIEKRDGVAIDRDLKVVHGGQKYDFEVVAPGTSFDVEVFVENPEPDLMGLLVAGFDQIKEGFTAVGGFSSRGLGRVTFEWTEMLEMDAKGLLSGNTGTRITEPSAIEARFNDYRGALAKSFEAK